MEWLTSPEARQAVGQALSLLLRDVGQAWSAGRFSAGIGCLVLAVAIVAALGRSLIRDLGPAVLGSSGSREVLRVGAKATTAITLLLVGLWWLGQALGH